MTETTQTIKSKPLPGNEFMANGNKYFIHDSISVIRYKEYEKLTSELAYGISFKDIFQNLRKAWDFLNKPAPEPMSAGVIIHNVMNGIKGYEDPKREHPALMMAALVILREGEDPAKYDEKLMLDKIKDWQEEGYDFASFLALSINAIHGFRETLIAYTNQTLNKLNMELEKDETTNPA